MDRRKLVMAGIVSGSIALGGLLGVTVLAPGIGFAASGSEASDELAGACVGVLGGEPIQVAAEAIGIEPSELLAALRDGQTIAEVAEANGVDPSTVIDAIVADAQERLDQAVEDGVLTQAEADERAADLEERATAFVNGEVSMFEHEMPLIGHPGLWGFADGPLSAAATAIGIEPVELLQQLRDGQTIAEVAEANGVDVATVVDAVVAAMQERLDSAVDNGWITQEQADERAAQLEEQATALVNGDLMPLPGPWFGHGPFGGGSDETGSGATGTDGSGASTTVASPV
jgi:ribosomal protein S20